MVYGVDGGRELFTAGRLDAVPVAEHRRTPRLVECGPGAYPVAQVLEGEHRVVGEPVGGVPDRPAAGVLQLLRQVPVVQRDPGLHTPTEQLVDQAVVERETGRVGWAGTAGLYPGPGQREAVRVDAEILDQADIVRHAVIVVAGHVTVIAMGHGARHTAERVANARCATILIRRALNLVRGRGDDPPEIWRKAREEVGQGGPHGAE